MIKASLKAFANRDQNDWVKLLLMAEFTYTNTKNASINHTPFKLNYEFHLQVSFEKDVDPHSKFRMTMN